MTGTLDRIERVLALPAGRREDGTFRVDTRG
jgi:hypothetical protein